MFRNARNGENGESGEKSPEGWQKFKFTMGLANIQTTCQSGSLESEDYDENGEYDENSENQTAMAKITNLAKIRQRVRVGLIRLVNQAKIWLNSNSKRRCQ